MRVSHGRGGQLRASRDGVHWIQHMLPRHEVDCTDAVFANPDDQALSAAGLVVDANMFVGEVIRPQPPGGSPVSAARRSAWADHRMRSAASPRESPATSVSQASASMPVALRMASTN